MSDATRELQQLLGADQPDRDAIRALLDGVDHGQRLAAARALGRAQQRALYSAVDGFLPVQLVDMVPPQIDDEVCVHHHGRNTLPAFTLFEKRFYRPAGEDREKPTALCGFNFQTMSPVTGPGWFTASDDAARGEVRIDYTRVPETVPEGWPAPRANERGLSRFVYGFMVDTLRRVSEHVTIGSAARKGRDMGSWFVLVREDRDA